MAEVTNTENTFGDPSGFQAYQTNAPQVNGQACCSNILKTFDTVQNGVVVKLLEAEARSTDILSHNAMCKSPTRNGQHLSREKLSDLSGPYRALGD